MKPTPHPPGSFPKQVLFICWKLTSSATRSGPQHHFLTCHFYFLTFPFTCPQMHPGCSSPSLLPLHQVWNCLTLQAAGSLSSWESTVLLEMTVDGKKKSEWQNSLNSLQFTLALTKIYMENATRFSPLSVLLSRRESLTFLKYSCLNISKSEIYLQSIFNIPFSTKWHLES